jgi:aminoglycoside phosphotransferase (APT) family kinase protein
MNSELQEQLQRYYQRGDKDFRITDLTAITDGWETEVYSFTLTLRHQTEHFILRIYPGNDAVEKSTREFQGMRGLRSSGYPVPRVMRHETDSTWLGKPFIDMQKIDGRSLGQAMREEPARWTEWVARFVQLLVDLHRVDYQGFSFLEIGEPSDFLPRKLTRGRTAIVEQLGQAWAVPVLDWLDARMRDIRTERLSVLHNDFHPYNILITPTNDAYVIDWGGIEVGDYRYDLAWTLLLSATHGSQQERDLILSEYQRIAGQPVEQIEYFEVIAALRRLLGFVVSMSRGAETFGMRPEAVAIMRREHEHFRRVYAILHKHSGLELPEIERLLESMLG